ncbi:MAG: hypothetical protein K8S94_02845 [Planctomycetia bacterium]|nr:hypothetical protein [Planctomycetia bacterium]
MTSEHRPSGTIVHEIRWSDAFPWWLLFRAAGVAFSPTVILLAALGAVATWAGWSACDSLGLAAADGMVTSGDVGGLVLPGAAGGAVATPLAPSVAAAPWLHDWGRRLPRPLAQLVTLVSVPFSPTALWSERLGALARIGWFVLVWSIFGTGITRHVALKLVGEEPPGPIGATLYGSRKWLPSFNSVLFVLFGILALSVPGALLGLAMRTEWGLAFAGAVWPLVLLGAVVLAILAVGVVAGWPLMVAAVGVERGDSFQAISTAFSYLYQRPLHYAFYALVALLVAVPALAAAGLFADATGTLAMWAASFGMGHERTAAVLDGLAGTGTEAASWGVKAISFWSRGLATLLSSFGWGYFWAIATAAYMLLRQDVDGTELDEVVIDEPGSES